MIIFHLRSHSGVPPYLQIVQQVKQNIRTGFLKEGDKLPTVKEVVTMITVNPNTVVKGYKELENQGFVEGRAGIGTFIRKQATGPPPDVQAGLVDELTIWLSKAHALGLDEESTEALFYTALHNDKRRETL